MSQKRMIDKRDTVRVQPVGKPSEFTIKQTPTVARHETVASAHQTSTHSDHHRFPGTVLGQYSTCGTPQHNAVCRVQDG